MSAFAAKVIRAGAAKKGAKSGVSKAQVIRGGSARARTRAANDNPVQRQIWTHPRPQQAANDNTKKFGPIKITNLEGKLWAAAATAPILGIIFWTELFHMAFGMVAVAGVAAEWYLEGELLGIGAYVFPGTYLFAAGYIPALLLSAASFIVTGVVYTLRGVDCFSGNKSIALGGAIILSFLPVPLPWVTLWIGTVILDQ